MSLTDPNGQNSLANYINTLFSPPVLAALRNVLGAVGLLLGMIGIGTLSPEKVQKVIEFATQLGTTIGAIVALLGIISPLVMGAIAAVKSTQAAQVARVKEIAVGPASDVALQAQTALVSATAAVAADPSIPKSNEAKNTLIAATAQLPNVQAVVTDKATADAIPSASVVAAEETETR